MAMADGSTQPQEPGILDSLPQARPQRRSAKRGAPGATAPPRAKRKPAQQPRKPPPPKQAPRAQAPVEPPSSTELLASAASAVGELAQLGLKLSEQLLRAATQRIPKP